MINTDIPAKVASPLDLSTQQGTRISWTLFLKHPTRPMVTGATVWAILFSRKQR